ncbi:MAG TPA: hypothetical protein VKY92_04835 [Verrucomicrobiae bacterium]|nr:hypothetical protein [Verrucomicrobiae bacterium]
MKKLSATLFLGLLGLGVFGFCGCASTQDSENASVRPWNAPMGWENGLPSTMREGR